MEKKEQLLIIKPEHELKFRGPFNQAITSHMLLKNPTDKPILFKIKTTAPKRYCVRPNSGLLEPNNFIEVGICLQPFDFDPNEKNRHKFMVQSLVAPDGEFNAEQLWKEVKPEELMDSKLRCVFEFPDDKKQTSATEEDAKLKQNTTSGSDATGSSGTADDKARDSSDYARVSAEVRQLRDGESQLRQENMQLKEENLRLRMLNDMNSKKETSAAFQNPYSPPQLAQQQLPVKYIAIAIAMALFGLILGKFVL
ncbi:vesicle-associated membrane protein-associated protein B [Sitodiplosis mosellana]|uniref:vesicle-associated membrane protein-associated protein B n=1 Tax=Sitodiplosis mosellana TaxID=263140 RepID=UPI002443F87E|nr:vesicle-associated membrane protein-associated protein B [Sitodiplosis mosellana]